MVKSVLPCFVVIRRQPVLSFRSTFSSSASPSLFARTAKFPPFLFNQFRNLVSNQTTIRPLFSYPCTLFCTLKNHISPVFKRFRTLCPKPPGVGYPQILLSRAVFWRRLLPRPSILPLMPTLWHSHSWLCPCGRELIRKGTR